MKTFYKNGDMNQNKEFWAVVNGNVMDQKLVVKKDNKFFLVETGEEVNEKDSTLYNGKY